MLRYESRSDKFAPISSQLRQKVSTRRVTQLRRETTVLSRDSRRSGEDYFCYWNEMDVKNYFEGAFSVRDWLQIWWFSRYQFVAPGSQLADLRYFRGR